MTTINAQLIGDQALLPRHQLEKLIEMARRSEELDVKLLEDDAPTWAWMRFIDQNGAFDFWKEPEEGIYSLQDGEPV